MTITKAKPKTTKQETATADFIAGARFRHGKGVKKGQQTADQLTHDPCPACQGGRAGGEMGQSRAP